MSEKHTGLPSATGIAVPNYQVPSWQMKQLRKAIQPPDDDRVMLTFEAGYSRRGEVVIGHGECFRCHLEKVTFYMDGSQGEYGGIELCQECINSLFGEWRMSQESDSKTNA